MADTSNVTPLQKAVNDPHNEEAKKYYIFNETGNIMISSTVDGSQPLSDVTQKIFAEVSVFFAGMTRAITTTKNPATGQPYSIYNYTALQNIIGGSGLFVHVTEEDVSYSTNSFGVDFSKELIESLLGLATGAGEMSFASAMMASIGKEGLRISGSSSTTESKVGNIVFVCEYLLGMPIVSAIVVYADCKQHVQQLQVGPCFKESSVTTNWIMHKDTYLFVTPTFIREYASDLDSIESDPNYVTLIHWLQNLLCQTPSITGIFDANKQPVASDTALAPSETYTLTGEFLPQDKGTLKFMTGNNTINSGNWSPTEISFPVAAGKTPFS